MTSPALARPPVALIAEDEPVLADALRRQLARLWPDLHVLPVASDGIRACKMAEEARPDLLFLDIHMPGLTGLEAAERVIEDWPPEQPLPLIVFITAYDSYAVAAFDRAAVDYVLKPVRPERLAMTCLRLQAQLAMRANPRTGADPHPLPSQLISLQGHGEAQAEPLHVLQAASGSSVYLVPVDDIVYLEAADKYVRVIAMGHHQADKAHHVPELLIRTPLRELLPRLPGGQFWQIHRSHVVNVRTIERVSRHNHRTRVHLRGRPETLDVSRMYLHLFKAM
jgi:DNA-binding LytR/AlgR family response regulator